MEPYYASSAEGDVYIDSNPSEGTGTDYWGASGKSASQGGYYSIQRQDAKGDGTVPESSGSALKDKSQGIRKGAGFKVIDSVEHGDFYNDGQVRAFTTNCILELASKHFKDRMGG